MADDADRAGMDDEMLTDMNLRAIRQKATDMPIGICGECNLCGEYHVRLVKNNCPSCRDKYKLP